MNDQDYQWLLLLERDNDTPAPQAVLDRLERQKLIQTSIDEMHCTGLTEEGRRILRSEERAREQQRQQRAEQKAQKAEDETRSMLQRRKDAKHDYIVAIVGAIAGVLGTLVVQYFSVIIEFFRRIMKR